MAPGQEVLLQSVAGVEPPLQKHSGCQPYAEHNLVIGRDEEGYKIKMTPKNILIDKEDMRLAEKNGR
jgi:hypothetical protein